MLLILMFVALCSKLSFAKQSLDSFEKVEATVFYFMWRAGHTPILSNTLDSKISPEEICATGCLDTPYFCSSFILTDVENQLECHYFMERASEIGRMGNIVNPAVEMQVRSQYDLTTDYDYVSTVSKLSKDYIRISKEDWLQMAHDRYCSPVSMKNWVLDQFLRVCYNSGQRVAIRDTHIPSSTMTASRSDILARRPLISALRSWNADHPQSSTSFYQLVLLFLKLNKREQTTSYSSSEYFFALVDDHNSDDDDDFADRYEQAGSPRVLVVPFDSGHYVTITAGSSHDEITYITDGDATQAEKRVDEAWEIYQKLSDETLELDPGTTKRRLLDGVRKRRISIINFPSDQLSPPQVRRELATAVVGHITTAIDQQHGENIRFNNPLLPKAVEEMMTFVFSWIYKVRQADLEPIFFDSQNMKSILGTSETGSQNGLTRRIADVSIITVPRDLKVATSEVTGRKRKIASETDPEAKRHKPE